MANVLDMFKDVLSEIQKRYAKHELEKGDSWRQMSIESLYNLLIDEIEELCTTELGTPEEFDELIDVILASLMLAQSLLARKRQLEENLNG